MIASTLALWKGPINMKAAALGLVFGAILVDNVALSGMLIAAALVLFALAKVGEWLR